MANEIERSLSTYPTRWYVSYFHETYNFIPFRNEFFSLLKDELKQREKQLLRELNADGKMGFAEVDKKCGQEPGRASYAYHGLKEKGILKRSTINMTYMPVKYIGIIYASFINREKFDSHRKDLLSNIIKETDLPITKYLLVGDVGVPHGGIYFVPVFNDGDLERAKESLEKINPGLFVETSIVSNVLVGTFCYRKYDNTYSRQYEILVDKFKVPPKERIYHEVREAKSQNKRIDFTLKSEDEDEI